MSPCRRLIIAACALLAAGAGGNLALGDEPALRPIPLATITLANGDTIHAAIVSDGDPLVIDHPMLGRMSIPRERIRGILKDEPPAAAPAPQPPPPPPPAGAPGPPAPAPAQISVAAPVAPPAPAQAAPPQLPKVEAVPSLLDLWKFSVEAGLNGTSGANQTQNFRALISANRPTPEMTTNAAVGWWYSRTNDDPTADRVQIDARNEWPVAANSAWSYYVAARSEYDEFQAWDWRLSGNAGLGWNVLKDDSLTVTARSGFGASREYGSSNPTAHAEFVPSLDCEFKINARNKLCSSLAGAIDLEHADGTHADLKAWYEAVLDPDHGMNLKIGVEDRYERSPGIGRVQHTLDYFAVIVFSF